MRDLVLSRNYRWSICATVGARRHIAMRIRRFDSSLPTIMDKKVTLGDYLTEAQLRTLVKDYQVEQKYGAKPYREKTGSRTPKCRQSEELSDIDAIRKRVQRQRHIRHGVERRKKPIPYLSQQEAIARYERRGERLERGEEMFYIGQGQAIRKHSDIRATTVPGGRGHRGARITKRPYCV